MARSEDKKAFVEELGELVRKHSDGKIAGMRYERAGRTEAAIIYYEDDDVKTVDIAGSDVAHILRDVGVMLTRYHKG